MRDVSPEFTGQSAAGADMDGEWDVPDDAALIRQSVRAPECFAALFDRHARAIHGYIARRLGRDAADDMLAQTFLVAFGRRDRYDLGHADARPWLYGIA